ncbi:hypothetical protein LX32DRAFT_697106 [Colletotrichum zoysiae]|uniref:F-box domain-containing protein n=1 Tax=Colletotrichum zoysiae TaxID=1216348 RepID=A0AAD9LXA7_9PEZI|nr:hypothetical protein LX32DRAFT_697106 [Colletotrichum zoysiae]
MPLHRAQLYADSIVTLVDFGPGVPQDSMRRMVSRLKALRFPKLAVLQGLRVESKDQISLLKCLARTAPGLNTIEVDTWPESGSILTVLSRFTALTCLDVDLVYGGPRAVDGLEDYEADTQAAVWKELRSASLTWGHTGCERIPPKMTKTLVQSARLVELRLRSKVYGDDLGRYSEGSAQEALSLRTLHTLELWPANRRAWEWVGAMSGLRSLTLSFLPGEAEPEDLLCLSPLSGLTELVITQRPTIVRATFPLAAEHLLEMTASMRGLELLRCDLASGSLHNAKGLTERIACEHPRLKELRFGFGIYQPDESLLASAFLPRHQSMRRLLVSKVLAVNKGVEHVDPVVSLEHLDRAADAFKSLFPQLEVFRTEEDPFEKVF